VTFDCTPAVRRTALRAVAGMATVDATLTTPKVAEGVRYSTTTVRQALEDLQALGVLSVTKGGQGVPDRWAVRDEWHTALDTLKRLENAPQTRREETLMAKAVENIAGLVKTGDYEASIALLKITGMYGGMVNAQSETDPENIIRTMAEAQVQREGIPRDATHEALIRLTENTRYHERWQEIEAELMREYGEGCEGKQDLDGRG
jgi:predicted ArsR family transcriptional regulator